MNARLLLLLLAFALYGCANNKEPQYEMEGKAVELIKAMDTSTLSFLKTWNYTNRMNYYNIWTKVKSNDSLKYSFLYEPIGDTTYIEIYEVANFLRDYKTTFDFDTTGPEFYRLAKVNNNIISIYPDGQISGSKNMITTATPIDRIFTENNPFSKIEKINHYKDKFNFNYCIYTPNKGNFLRFAYSNTNENILYYIPDNLIISDKNLFSWIDKFSKGKRLARNWIFVNRDNPELENHQPASDILQ